MFRVYLILTAFLLMECCGNGDRDGDLEESEESEDSEETALANPVKTLAENIFDVVLPQLCGAPTRQFGCWVDAQNGDLGYLWFEKSRKKTSEAAKFCKDQDSNLVEVYTVKQLNYLRKSLSRIEANHDDWWSGASYKHSKRDWVWRNSDTAVDGNLIWKLNEPQFNPPTYWTHICFVRDFDTTDNFKGDQCDDGPHYPICQKT